MKSYRVGKKGTEDKDRKNTSSPGLQGGNAEQGGGLKQYERIGGAAEDSLGVKTLLQGHSTEKSKLPVG